GAYYRITVRNRISLLFLKIKGAVPRIASNIKDTKIPRYKKNRSLGKSAAEVFIFRKIFMGKSCSCLRFVSPFQRLPNGRDIKNPGKFQIDLLHGYRFGKVSGLIDILSQQQGNVIGQ